jgi:hypothetical protein
VNMGLAKDPYEDDSESTPSSGVRESSDRKKSPSFKKLER